MKFKLDENMPRRAATLLSGYGHEVATVADESLGGSEDPLVAQTAAQEGRMVVTLDRRFADIRLYPPGHHPGIIVLRLPDQSSAIIPPATAPGAKKKRDMGFIAELKRRNVFRVGIA